MKKFKSFDFRKTLTLLLALLTALCLVFGVACDDTATTSSSSSDETEEDEVTPTDYQSIKNGDFEFGTFDDDVTYPVYTGINWTRYRDNSYSSSAISSTKNSGIIDTDDEAYNDIASTNNFPKEDDSDEYWNPHTPEYYGLSTEGQGGTRYTYDEETFEDNPNEDKYVTSGSKILMIHNVTATSGRGTAQKFVSSSSLTSSTGYAKISVWVMTKDLKTLQDTEEFGAYISINNTLSSSRSPFLIKNINTEGKWACYVVYLETSDYVESSYTVTVGLGFGSDEYMAEYVEGFAYFDEIHFEELDQTTYETETADVADGNKYSLFDDDGNEVTKDRLKVSQTGTTYSDEYTANVDENGTVTENATGKATTVKYIYSHLMASEDATPSTVTGEYNEVYPVTTEYKTGATGGVAAFNTLAIDGVTNPVSEDAQTVYIKLDSPSTYSVTTGSYKIADGAYKQYNFLTNVGTELAGQPGATFEVIEVDKDGNELGTVSVAEDYTTYSSDDGANVWKTISIFVSNDTGTERYIQFRLTLGATGELSSGGTDYSLTKGYALLTDINTRDLPEEEYNNVSSEADYTSTITLGYEYPNGMEDDDDDDDDFAFTATNATSGNLYTQPAVGVVDYTGVVGGHTMTGGENKAYTDENVVSGIVSSKYISDETYTELTDDTKAAVQSLAGSSNIQPLVIQNNAMATYGYLGSSLTFSANTTTLVTVQVKVLDGATAYVYLANADPLSNFGVLNVSTNNDGDKELMVTVTSTNAPTSDSEWVTVNFLVTTGDEDITYRVELWNGARDGSVQSAGTVIFNKVETSTPDSANAVKAQLEADFGTAKSEYEYTRATATVTTTDSDGNETTYERTYEPTVVFTEYTNGASIIASYETIDAATEIDETDTDDDDDDDSSDDSSDTTDTTDATVNVALQITSIVIAAVLILVLIVVIIRMLVKKHKKVEVSSANYYNRDSRQKAQQIINENKAKRSLQAKKEAEKAAAEKAEAEKAAAAEKAEETPSDTSESEDGNEEPSDGNTDGGNEEPADGTGEGGSEEPADGDGEGEKEEKPYDYDNPENNI